MLILLLRKFTVFLKKKSLEKLIVNWEGILNR